MPALGAGSFDALAAFQIGWNLNFYFLLDGDGQGVAERQRYCREFGISESRLLLLSDLASSVVVIEDILDDNAKAIVAQTLAIKGKPSKPQIKRFFQEKLASNSISDLGPEFAKRSEAILNELRARLSQAL